MIGLDAWPTIKLADMPLRDVGIKEFASALVDAQEPHTFLRTNVSSRGAAELHLHSIMDSVESITPDVEVQKFINRFCQYKRHDWSNSYLYFSNSPWYLVPETGVIFSENGELLRDSVYESTGDRSIERFVGGGFGADAIPSLFANASVINGLCCAPMFSRWSDVYFHALSESMVQDVAFFRAGISGYLQYVAPGASRGAQELIIDNARALVTRVEPKIVKVPRIVFSSMLYQHAAMGTDFLNFVYATKSFAPQEEHPSGSSSNSFVYVSRIGSPARRMLNEPQLVSVLEQKGFKIFHGSGKKLNEQVLAFREARLIVGAHGAGLTNAAFARPGSVVLELRPLNRRGESPMWSDAYRKLCAVMGFGYAAHISSNAPDSEEWVANIPEIIGLIDQLALPT